MADFTDMQIRILRDLASAGGSLIVAMDVVHGPLIDLWLKELVRSNTITISQLELHLTEKGWRAAAELANGTV